MGINHLAFAARDIQATHRFYTEVMGFRLAKVVASPTPEGGWARHVFYDTGAGSNQMLAFWDLHVEKLGHDFPVDLNRSLGLPAWVNHLAFDAPTLDDLDAHERRWREHGITVARIDHGFCESIYATDPNGIMVEFCCTTRELDEHDAAEAAALLAAEKPELEAPPEARFLPPLTPAPTA